MSGITKDQIVFDLKLMGIAPGDVILMHSALSSIGRVEGGADAVIDALLEAVGESGTVAASTLSFGEPFDAATTPSTVGAISEALRKRPGACRSLHPVHSIAAVGAQAKYLTEGHENATGCGLGSPYVKLRDMNGKILLLGVDMNRNTTLHALEDVMNSCYLEDRIVKAPTYQPDYEGKMLTITKFPPGHRDFLRSTPVLRSAGALTEGYIGNAVVKVIGVRKMFGVLLEKLADDPMFFMCDNPACEYCARAHAKLAAKRA